MTSFFKKVLQSITVQSVQGYECERDPALQLGQWKIYNAKCKTRLGSVWICDSKSQTQPRKEYSSLIRLKYPGILQVLEPLIEEKSYIAFVTEKIDHTLSQAMSDSTFQLSDIEMKLHLLEVIDGIQFLHNNVRQVHLDLCPDKVFITEGGKWKIGGSPIQQQVLGSLADCTQIDLNERNSVNKLNYMAPELLQTKPQCANATDIFSLGMILLRLMKFRHNRIAFPEFTQPEQYKNYIQQLPTEVLRYKDLFPESFLRFLGSMLANNVQSRPSLAQFVSNEWFKDPYLITFNILNKLPEYGMQQQITFFKGLSLVIFTFEKEMLKKRLLPIILSLVQFDHLLTPIVQVILETIRREDIITPQQFQTQIWPKLKTIIQGKEIPAQVLYDLVLAIPIFHKYIPQKELQDHLIPLLIKCYECKVPKLQDLGLKITEFVLEHNDYTFSKTKILPRVFTLCVDNNIEIRKTALVCVYKTLNVMDADIVLNSLEKIKSMGTDRELNQIVLKIYQSLSKTLTSELVANKLLPQITPYLTDTTLTKAEFNEYYDTLLQMLGKIKSEKEKTLSDQDKGVIKIDYKLSLPEPKRIADGKGDKFEFLNQFETTLNIIPDKPEIQEQSTQQQQQQQQQQQVQIPLQLGQPIVQGTPIQSLYGQTQNTLYQPQQPQQFQQDPFQFSNPQQQQQSNPIGQKGFDSFTPQTQNTNLNFDILNPVVKQTSTQSNPNCNDWGQVFQTQDQKLFSDPKQISQKPLFNQHKLVDPFQNQPKQDNIFNDPFKMANDPWNNVNDPWQQTTSQQPQNLFNGNVNTNANATNNNNNNKNKYASFDELI